jgi:glycosyltransferase involved in cell wall biosynthesis
MTILMLLESDFPPDIRVENEIEALVNEGHVIYLVCPTRSGKKSVEVLESGITVYRRNLPKLLYKSKVGQLKFPFYDWYWRWLIGWSLKRIQPQIDLIHAHDLSLLNAAIWTKKKINTTILMDLHENYPYLIKNAKHTQKGLGKWLSDYKQWIEFEKVTIPQADYVVCVVEEMKERMLQFDPRPNRYFVYQNVVNSESILPYEVKPAENELKMIYVGGITPSRGIKTVIEAISKLKKRGEKVLFNIYGQGSYVEELMDFAEEKGVENKVVFHGNIPQEDVFEKIQEHDVAIIPHYKSVQNDCSSPNKLFQYLSTGTPVITSDCNSLERIVTKHDVGLVYSNNDSNELAEILVEAKENSDDLIEKGKNGYDLVIEKFNTDNEGEILIKMYASIAKDLEK